MELLAARLWRDTFLRYFGASVIALGCDAGSFFTMLRLGVPAAGAAALAYSLGILVHWLVTSRAVFASELAERGSARTRQKAMFVGSALAGLALTTLVVSAAATLGANLLLAKGIAVALSFTLTWVLRRWVIFRPHVATA